MADEPTLNDVAQTVGVSPATLRRWVREGVVPLPTGRWTPAAIAHARIVGRLRERGHTLRSLRQAVQSGRLAFGYMEDLFPVDPGQVTIEEAAADTGLQPALVRRVLGAIGYPERDADHLSQDDLQLLRYFAAVLSTGYPLVAFLQLVRVYGQALAQIADAEVKLFHLYVHEPLIRDGVPSLEMAEEMESLARELLPLASPVMDHLHQRFLQHFVEQDVVGHIEAQAEEDQELLDLGRLRVAVAFADLAGYTRLTEEAGEETALDVVERFVDHVANTLPDDARIVKTIGDEVMVVGSDPTQLVDWAVGFQTLMTERPLPRIGIHYGAALYRDGDYYGSAINLASRVGARAAGGEVLVTRPVAEAAARDLELTQIGEVKLKGFAEATELFVARMHVEG